MTDFGWRGFGLVLLCVTTLLGCAAGTRVPEDSFYRLDIPLPTHVPDKPVLDGVLLVEFGAAAPIYRDRSLLYSDNIAPARLQRYHYRHWVDSPPSLLEYGLAKYLSAAGAATLVVTPEERVEWLYRLALRLERFEHLRDEASGAVVTEAKLMLSKRGLGLPVRHVRLRAEAVVQGSDFMGVIAAYRRCAESLYSQVQAMLVGFD